MEIKSIYGDVLYEADVSSMRECVEAAARAGAILSDAALLGANLWGADLSGANLRGADLRGAVLTGANLRGADLRGAVLTGANLRGANLSGANLSYANLRGANLRGANLSDAALSDAALSDADLSGADLSYANLPDANLRGANLWGANLSDANLSDANLSGAKGLDEVRSMNVLSAAGVIGLDRRLWTMTFGRHRIVVWGGQVIIGCQSHPLTHWAKNYAEIGRLNNYSAEDVALYGCAIKFIQAQMWRESLGKGDAR